MNPVETGFYYLQSRYYDPESCRFLSADDPSMLELSTVSLIGENLFAYCNNNPVNFIDNTGVFWNSSSMGLCSFRCS